MLRKFLAFALVAMLPAVASAQPTQGDWALTLSGQGQNDVDFDAVTASAAGSLGYFFTDELEGFVRQSLIYSDVGGSSWNGSTFVGVDYHFDAGNWQPFIGAGIGYIYGDAYDDQFVAGPEVGVKYFVNRTTFIELLAQYQFFFEDSDDAEDSIDDGQFVYALGIGFLF